MMKISAAVVFFTVLFGASSPSFPGDVDSPGDPLDGSGMPRLEDLYQYLIYGTLWEDPGRFQEPGSGPGSTGHNLKEIYDDVRSDFIHCDATPDQVVSGATYFSTAGGTWGPTAGAAPNVGRQNITPGATPRTIEQGFHDGTGEVAGDADLTSSNIVDGVRIFDVTGSYECPVDCVGTANTGDVLEGRTFSNDAAAGVTGTMPNVGRQNISPGTTSRTITEGFHDGSGKVAGDGDLTSGNIVNGVRIFDVTGSYECPFDCAGTADAGDVLAGQTFSNDAAAGVTGTMENHGAFGLSCGAGDQSVAAGYYSGGTLSGDSELLQGNIANGVEIFGVTGNAVLASGAATDADVLTGVTYSNASGGSTGSMPDREGDNASTAREALAGFNYLTAPSGFYDGDDRVSATDAEVAALDGDLAAGNIVAGVEIFGVPGSAVVATGVASNGEVLTGVTYSNASGGSTGSMPDREGDNASTAREAFAGFNYLTAPSGFYDGDDRVSATDAEVAALDIDLAAENIKCGVTIFGVAGGACFAKTGQEKCWAGSYPFNEIACANTGQDGEHQKGCDPELAPSNGMYFGNYNRTSISSSPPGFTDNRDGTVTDNLTCLIWLKDASCVALAGTDANGRGSWSTALSAANSLADGTCGLSDGSSAGDWRLPNINELRSLFDPNLPAPYLQTILFTNVQSHLYWSSSTNATSPPHAWFVSLFIGAADYVANKESTLYVWPVRAGQ